MKFYTILDSLRLLVYWDSNKRKNKDLKVWSCTLLPLSPNTHAHIPTHTRTSFSLPLQNLLRQDKCGTCNCARALISPHWLIMVLWKPCAHYASLCCFYCTAWLIIFFFFQENPEGLMLSLVPQAVLPLWRANSCKNKAINKWMIKKTIPFFKIQGIIDGLL